jgi:hypothetical protein
MGNTHRESGGSGIIWILFLTTVPGVGVTDDDIEAYNFK